jgi:type I restriction enzyme R subunit
VFEYSLAQGIEDGFLAPYRVRRVVLSPDAHGWSPEPGQLDRFGREIPPGVYATPHFERVVSLLSRTDAAARHLTDYLGHTDPMAKTIVFCVDSEHAEQMRQALSNANAARVRQHPNYVVRIVAAEGDVGTEHLGAFMDVESDTPVIATTSKLLGTGVDIPTVKNIVLFKPIGSMVEFKQIIGRGTRLYPDDDKLTFDIIDYSGATALFADPAGGRGRRGITRARRPRGRPRRRGVARGAGRAQVLRRCRRGVRQRGGLLSPRAEPRVAARRVPRLRRR